MIYLTVAFYVSEWLIRIGMLLIVPRRRPPSAAMAWLLVIFFEPLVGLALYALIGEPRLSRARRQRHARLLAEAAALRLRFKERLSIARPALLPAQEATVKLARQLADMPIVAGNDGELLADTDEVITRLIHDIDEARANVHLLFYIFRDDVSGRRVLGALFRAAQRGVKCRVLVDAVGSRPLLRSAAAEARRAGVELRAALPVGILRRPLTRIDIRNHRKLAVIDGRMAYTGSQNIVDPSYGHRDLVWQDLMVRLTGPIVLELQGVFCADWRHETDELLDGDDIFPAPIATGEIAVQALPSGPNYPTENYHRVLVSALHAAQEQVTITTPYFVPDAIFLAALEVAALRGVSVELIVPARSDQALVGAATRAFFDDVLRLGAKVYLYERGLLHAKTMTVDNAFAFLGTSNFDIRSFTLNFELNLIFYGARETMFLRAQQRRYRAEARPLDVEQWRRRPLYKRLGHNVAKLLSPLL
jgi:cardiolipin synthase